MRRRHKTRRLSRIALLPTLLTLGNLVCGFAAVHVTMKYLMGADVVGSGVIASERLEMGRWLPSNLAVGAYLIFAAMAFDALDGRVARLTRKTSDFGSQLDSLADVVSFGVAPGFLLIGMAGRALAGNSWTISPISEGAIGRAVWIIGAIYACCTALRLARFNVENVHDEAAHMTFKGLPSPGAAGMVAAMVLLYEDVLWRHHTMWFSQVLLWSMPMVTLAAGLLMVSRIRYAHLVNRYLRGRHPWSILLWFLLLGGVFVIWPQLVLAVLMLLYAASGPAKAAYRYATTGQWGEPHPEPAAAAPPQEPLEREPDWPRRRLDLNRE